MVCIGILSKCSLALFYVIVGLDPRSNAVKCDKIKSETSDRLCFLLLTMGHVLVISNAKLMKTAQIYKQLTV